MRRQSSSCTSSEISVSSEMGSGSTFVFSAPFDEVAQPMEVCDAA